MSAKLSNVVDAYAAAWCEPDEENRRKLLVESWEIDGLYQDPTGEARGLEALVAHIGAFLVAQPGARLELTSGVTTHHDKIYFNWRMVLADKTVAMEGVDFGHLGPGGRLTAITGFFSPPPAIIESGEK